MAPSENEGIHESPEHKFPRKIKAKRLVDVQTESEQDCNEALFAVDVLLTGPAAVELGLSGAVSVEALVPREGIELSMLLI